VSTREIPFLDLRAINVRHADAYAAALQRVLGSGRVLLGEETDAFEHEFARHCGAAHAVGVSNGLDALHLTLRAWGIGPGDEVIVPSNTFIATWLAVTHAGAKPVPAEPDATTHNLDPQRVADAIGPRTRAIIAVHLYGRPAPMEALRGVARRHGLHLLEDAAQAHGAAWRGRRCGSLADAAAFSFYPGKNLGALGDGGAVTTDDAALAQRLRLLRNYGSALKYVHEQPGFNSRLDELQAAFLRERLRVLDADNAHRARIAQRWIDALRATPGLALPLPDDADAHSSWHLFVVRHAQRDALAQALAQRGVATLVHYPTPPHRQRAYANSAAAALSLPIAERLACEVLSLPISPVLGDEDATRVGLAVREACERLSPATASASCAA
jgi:dTDP-3-amino-3,4,6-trideoxy-alpha-D-glucose transaminase